MTFGQRLPLAVLVTTLSLICRSAYALPIVIPVKCGGNTVGEIRVDTDGTGLKGGFASTVGGPPASLAGAASACGEDHFNWYQIVTATNIAVKNRQGTDLVTPWVDPPLNGLDPAIDPTWADNLPWYFDEYAPPAGTPNFSDAYQRSTQTAANLLTYFDYPGGHISSFTTWLVSLNADSSFHSFHEGFSWDFDTNVTNIRQVLVSPTDAQYRDITAGFAAAVPEPSTGLLVFTGILLVLGRMRRL